MFSHIQLVDGLHMYQDHDIELTTLGEVRHQVINAQTGELLHDREEPYTFEGSHTTSIVIRLSGKRVTITRGNPSKINRLDNLFGYKTVDECVFVYNNILISLGLPPFTRCTKKWYEQSKDGTKSLSVSDGAVITEIHTTSNKRVGQGNEEAYLRALSSQRLRNSIPKLEANGCTVQWLSRKGNAPLVHSCVYNKANEIALHQLPKIKKLYGEDSKQYRELLKVYNYCLKSGVVRFENKFKSASLRRQNLQFWGISDYSVLDDQQKEFLAIDRKLSVSKMTMQTISELLKEEGVCSSIQAANATAGYYFMWLQGQKFDLHKSQVRTHRARLRKIKVDIAEPCDISIHSAVRIKDIKEIIVQELACPEWYQLPKTSQLSLVR